MPGQGAKDRGASRHGRSAPRATRRMLVLAGRSRLLGADRSTMTSNLPLPTPGPRRTFPSISAVSWEHPADRAALQALRAIPGVDDVIRRILAFLGGERGVNLLFQGNAVRLGPSQLPKVWAIHQEVCATFDWHETPELFVTQTPVFNAGAYGIDRPFIVLHTPALEILDESEVRALLAHEMGHVVSGHVHYRTIAAILLKVSLSAFPFLTGMALLPIRLALLEWARKSELSCDRAGLLGCQDVLASHRLFLKLAGGGRGEAFDGELRVEPYLAQARGYAESHEGFDVVYKVLHTLALTHPLHTVRAAELQTWIASGDYEKILRGEYVRRGEEQPKRPLWNDVSEAGRHYADATRRTVSQVADAAREAADRLGEAFRRKPD